MSLIKNHFTSRHGKDGVIIEFDWCLAPNTRVLTSEFVWKKIGDVTLDDVLIGFEENVRTKDGRKFQLGKVEKIKRLKKESVKITTNEGEIVCSKDHMFLSSGGRLGHPTIWRKASELKPNYKIPKVCEVWETPDTWEAGWMGGFLDGEGYIDKTGGFGIGQSKKYVENHKLCSRMCKIMQKYMNISGLGTNTNEKQVVRVRPKGLRTGWQACGIFQPLRLKNKLLAAIKGQSTRSKRNRKVTIVSIEDIGIQEVVAVQTSCKTFLAEGLMSHNCQLEVCVFAYLTQDPQLINDLLEGIDIHCMLGSRAYGEKIEKKDPRRPMIKRGTFLFIYGGGAPKYSREHGVPLEQAQKLLDSFRNRYPIAKIWQDNLVKQVEGSAYLINEFTPKGHQKHEGFLISQTGRQYFFKTYDAPDFLVAKGVMTSFNPSEIKNYPVQGLATADIHLIALGNLWRASIAHRDKYLLINTIHDSVLVDCLKIHAEWACNHIKTVLESIKEDLKKKFNINFNAPLVIDIKMGESWGTCK